MTAQELAEFRELAGLNEPQSTTEIQKQWVDAQITNIPKVENQLPEPTLANFGLTDIKGHTYGGNSGVDTEIENLSNRLNNLLGSNFGATVKIERLQ